MEIVHSHEEQSKLAFLKNCNIRHFQISHNSPYLALSVCLSVCLSIYLSICITVAPREIKDCLCKTRSIMEDVKIANYPF